MHLYICYKSNSFFGVDSVCEKFPRQWCIILYKYLIIKSISTFHKAHLTNNTTKSGNEIQSFYFIFLDEVLALGELYVELQSMVRSSRIGMRR